MVVDCDPLDWSMLAVVEGIELATQLLNTITIPGDWQEECWVPAIRFIMKSGKAKGYVRIKALWGHRAVYEAFVGPIPPRWEVDHTCRNVSCLNTFHLEAVTRTENNRRMWDARRQCSHTERRWFKDARCLAGGYWGCNECRVERERRRYLARC